MLRSFIFPAWLYTRIVSSARSKNHTGTVSGRPSARTVVSHAIRLARNRPSACARRSSGKCDVSFMHSILADLRPLLSPALTRRRRPKPPGGRGARAAWCQNTEG
jgi:hypothetical protein